MMYIVLTSGPYQDARIHGYVSEHVPVWCGICRVFLQRVPSAAPTHAEARIRHVPYMARPCGSGMCQV